jgi:hypothetical protein
MLTVEKQRRAPPPPRRRAPWGGTPDEMPFLLGENEGKRLNACRDSCNAAASRGWGRPDAAFKPSSRPVTKPPIPALK